MKYHLTLLCFLFFLNSYSQPVKDKVSIHFKFSLGKDDAEHYQNYSIGGEWFVSPRIGLNYNLDFVQRTNDLNQLHTSVGMIGGPAVVAIGVVIGAQNNKNNVKNGAGFFTILGGLLILIMPEGITYHFPVAKNWDWGPYANVLGIDVVKEDVYESLLIDGHLRYSATFGFKVNYWDNKYLNAFGFVETRKTVGVDWTIGGGVGLGYAFRKGIN